MLTQTLSDPASSDPHAPARDHLTQGVDVMLMKMMRKWDEVYAAHPLLVTDGPAVRHEYARGYDSDVRDDFDAVPDPEGILKQRTPLTPNIAPPPPAPTPSKPENGGGDEEAARQMLTPSATCPANDPGCSSAHVVSVAEVRGDLGLIARHCHEESNEVLGYGSGHC